MLVDPAGHVLAPSSGKREVAVNDPDLARFAAVADHAFQRLHLSVICVHCGATPVGRNHENDAKWALECGCTVRRLRNPFKR